MFLLASRVIRTGRENYLLLLQRWTGCSRRTTVWVLSLDAAMVAYMDHGLRTKRPGPYYCNRWIKLNVDVFARTGKMMEKYSIMARVHL